MISSASPRSVVLLGLCVLTALATREVWSQQRTMDPRQREATASPNIKRQLTRQRQNIKARSQSFEVSYTVALDRRPEQLIGLTVPSSIRDRKRQGSPSAGAQRRLQAMQLSSDTCADSSRFDWRTSGVVGAVKDQGSCGSCWAFASNSVFESALSIASSSRPIDTAEQATLSCSGAGSCGGGWQAFDYMKGTGAIAESQFPYTGSDATCTDSSGNTHNKAVEYGYLGATPSVEELKQALCEHGPLWVGIKAGMQSFYAYAGGTYDAFDSGSIDHAVTLVGWDSTRTHSGGTGAWIIKNSWSTGWGESAGYGNEAGYAYVAFGSNSVGSSAYWVTADGDTPNDNTTPDNTTPDNTTPTTSQPMVSSGSTNDLDSHRAIYASVAASGHSAQDIVGMGIAGSNDHVYVWYSDGTVSSGSTSDLDNYRASYAYTLPSGKSPRDIVGMGIAGSNDHVYVWYSDGTASSGSTNDLDRYRAPYGYSTPLGKSPRDIVGMGIAGSNDHVYTWYSDGTASSGSSGDLDSYRALYRVATAPGKSAADIVGMGIAGSNDHTYTWWK